MTDSLGYCHTLYLADWFRGSSFPIVKTAHLSATAKERNEDDDEADGIWWPSFEKGELTFAMLHTNKRTGHCLAAETSLKSTRLLVQYRTGRVPPQQYRARKMRVLKAVPLTGWDVIISPSTVDFRYLARLIPNSDSLVLEIGCSTGAATRILADQVGDATRIIACDNSYDQMARCKQDPELAGVKLERVDVFSDEGLDLLHKWCTESVHFRPATESETDESTNKLLFQAKYATEETEAAAMKRHGGNLVVFMDIGGNRCHPDVAQAVPRVLAKLKPRVLVLKSEAFAQRAQEIGLAPDVPSMEESQVARYRSGYIRRVETKEELDKLWETRQSQVGISVQSAGFLAKKRKELENNDLGNDKNTEDVTVQTK